MAPTQYTTGGALQTNLKFRPGTDDDIWVIPQILHRDTYRAAYLASILPGTRPIIDGGAHIGVFSLLFAAHFPLSPVYCFEPQPENFALLLENTASLPNIACSRSALGLTDDPQTLYVSADTGRSSTREKPCVQTIPVSSVSLPDLLRRNGLTKILKLDLEGAEASLIDGTPAELLSSIHCLILETHHVPLNFERIKAAGFDLLFRPDDSEMHYVGLNRHYPPEN